MKIGVIVLTGLGVVCAGVWGIAALVVHKNGNNSLPPALVASPSPTSTTQASGSSPGSSFDETAKETCGDPPDASATWYAVFIDSGNLNEVHRRFCKDAIAATRQDSGKASIQVASFTDRSRAEAFARTVNGDVSRYEPNSPKKVKATEAKTSTSYDADALNATFLEVQEKVPGLPDTPESRDMVSSLATTYCDVKSKGVSDEMALRLYLNGVMKSNSSQDIKLLSSAVGGSIMYAAKTHLCP
ncbi:hypothetical protein H6F89_30280 [Cyanobacteria bacterium FACHB-63]|nr:hypothetical protein [Cyanobacteria bacterium FACHB-63]